MMQGSLEDITKAVGNTPIVRLNKVARDVPVEIYVKCEYLNPGGSHKDRLAANILRRAEEGGLKPGGTIVEATSGNTGASLALLAAVRGYKCIFVMPDKMSQEKIANLRAFGAKVVVCPTAVDADDPRSYYKVSRRIADETPNCFYANQYHNPANPEAHYLSTAPEIWRQTGGDFDVFVAGMGTGGTHQRVRQVLQGEEALDPDRRRRPCRLALLRLRQDGTRDQAVLLQGRGDRRGLLPHDDEPQDHRRHRPRRRQGVLLDDARAHAPRGALRRRLGRRRGRRRDQVRARDGRARRGEEERPPARSSSSSATAGTSTSPRSSTTTGCARTASSTSSPASAPCATSCSRASQADRHRDPDVDASAT